MLRNKARRMDAQSVASVTKMQVNPQEPGPSRVVYNEGDKRRPKGSLTQGVGSSRKDVAPAESVLKNREPVIRCREPIDVVNALPCVRSSGAGIIVFDDVKTTICTYKEQAYSGLMLRVRSRSEKGLTSSKRREGVLTPKCAGI